jgi:hypothetical protein
MPVLNIFSPAVVVGGHNTTQFVPNPWATKNKPATDAWVQTAINGLNIWDTAALAVFGIIEFESLDDHGHTQTKKFGNPHDLNHVLSDAIPTRLFIPRMVSVTLACLALNVGMVGEVTIFEWS